MGFLFFVAVIVSEVSCVLYLCRSLHSEVWLLRWIHQLQGGDSQKHGNIYLGYFHCLCLSLGKREARQLEVWLVLCPLDRRLVVLLLGRRLFGVVWNRREYFVERVVFARLFAPSLSFLLVV